MDLTNYISIPTKIIEIENHIDNKHAEADSENIVKADKRKVVFKRQKAHAAERCCHGADRWRYVHGAMGDKSILRDI